MKSTLELKELMLENNYTFIASNNDEEITSYLLGIAPLMLLLSSKPDFLNSANVCDKVVGKAAALLMKKGNVKEVFALTISESALEYLNCNNINVSYEKLVKNIMNRDKSDICPMEKRVIDISDCEEAYIVLKQAIKEMKKKA